MVGSKALLLPRLVGRDGSAFHVQTPSDAVQKRVGGSAHYLEAGQRHLDEDPLHFVEQSLEDSGNGLLRLAQGGRGIGGMPLAKQTDGGEDACLAVWPTAVLLEDAPALVREAVGPVEFSDLCGEMACGKNVWSAAVTRRPLEATVEESEEHRVLVGGGEGAHVKQGEESLRESDRALGVLPRGRIHQSLQYAARSGSTQRMPPRGSGESPT